MPDQICIFKSARQKKLLSDMFKNVRDSFSNQRESTRSGRFVTLKAITPTVVAKFHDSLKNLLGAMSKYDKKKA